MTYRSAWGTVWTPGSYWPPGSLQTLLTLQTIHVRQISLRIKSSEIWWNLKDFSVDRNNWFSYFPKIVFRTSFFKIIFELMWNSRTKSPSLLLLLRSLVPGNKIKGTCTHPLSWISRWSVCSSLSRLSLKYKVSSCFTIKGLLHNSFVDVLTTFQVTLCLYSLQLH